MSAKQTEGLPSAAEQKVAPKAADEVFPRKNGVSAVKHLISQLR